MKQAMTLFLCACALPTALLLPHARAEGVITLKSGEKLPGSMDTMNRPYLKVRSSIREAPRMVSAASPKAVFLDNPMATPASASASRAVNM